MSHLNKSFIKFFQELKKNNSKEWFDNNRKTYEKEIKGPFNNFVTNLILTISQFDESIDKDTKKAIFRINRDIRFSKDKTPYNTEVKAAFAKEGRKSPYPGYYLAIGPEKIHIGGGLYHIEKENLEKIRNHILNRQNDFLAIINNDTFKNTFGTVQGERNKKLSPEFKKLIEKTPLIANKQFYVMADVNSEDVIEKEDLIEFVTSYYRTVYKLNCFLWDALI